MSKLVFYEEPRGVWQWLKLLRANGEDCTYSPALVARATGADPLQLQRRYGEHVPAAVFRRLLTSKGKRG